MKSLQNQNERVEIQSLKGDTMIKLKISIWLLFACMISLMIIGCIAGKLTPQAEQQSLTPEEQVREEASKIARFTIKMPKTTYNLDEAIPIELKLNVGKFNLLVPEDSVEPEKMASHLVVKSADGSQIESRKIILPSKPEV